MSDTRSSSPKSLWLPLVTPFRDGLLDEPALRPLVARYAAGAVAVMILSGSARGAWRVDD